MSPTVSLFMAAQIRGANGENMVNGTMNMADLDTGINTVTNHVKIDNKPIVYR